jgi:high-affinity nickel-transport protein
MMLAFILGLLISNSLIAVLTATGFISSTRARSVYVAIGAIAGAFSLVIGLYFLLGASGDLPSLEPMSALIGGGAD